MNSSSSIFWGFFLLVGVAEVFSKNLLEKSPTRCENVCNDCRTLKKDLQGDCQRGCQYFNIVFLVSANDPSKVSSIDAYEGKCRSSCSEAYDPNERRNACFLGCSRMSEIQNQAPYINNWVIYMGESDRGMVLLPSDSETLNTKDWLLLESFLKEEEKDIGEKIVTDTIITERKIGSPGDFFGQNMPWWMWCIPIAMFMVALWDCHFDASARIIGEDLQHTHEIILNDKTIYPSLAVLPPKYSESEKDFLSGSDDEQKNVKTMISA